MNNPKHIAFIMDGNGRWAEKKNKPRTFGHQVGMEKITEVCNWCKIKGIKYGSFFGFSKDNWNRPKSEVSFLFSLVENYYKEKLKVFKKENIRFIHVGDKNTIPDYLLSAFNHLESETYSNASFYLLFFFNYSGRDEIIAASKKVCNDVQNNKIQLEDISEKNFSTFLQTQDIPDPDLLVRTSGELRISNFLLYQLAYTELYFEEQLWPDYSLDHFDLAISSFKNRKRRFGGI